MTIDLQTIIQGFLGASMLACVGWVAAKIQALATQVAILAEQVKDLRGEVISRELLEREIGSLNSKTEKLESGLDICFKEMRKVSAEHASCPSCKGK